MIHTLEAANTTRPCLASIPKPCDTARSEWSRSLDRRAKNEAQVQRRNIIEQKKKNTVGGTEGALFLGLVVFAGVGAVVRVVYNVEPALRA